MLTDLNILDDEYTPALAGMENTQTFKCSDLVRQIYQV